MSSRQRWFVLGLALIATLLAAFWTGREDTGEVVEAVRHEDKSARVVEGKGASEARPVVTERLASMQADMFPTQTWAPPPPPKPQVLLPPPTPQPPPLPFTYLGHWVDRGKETLFLAQGDQPIPIKAGQVLAGEWRVDEITARTVVFTYLPLNMQSTLGITP